MSIKKPAHPPREQFRHCDDAACTSTGPALDGTGQGRVFHHGGFNDSYRAWIEGDLENGGGFVILINAHNGAGLATEIRNPLTDRWLGALSKKPTMLSSATHA